MVTWQVQALDNLDEETKQAADIINLTSLFEIVKLAFFLPDEQVDSISELQIIGCNAYGFTTIAIDSSIYVFGENCSSLLIQITLEHPIDQIIWIPGGELVILADRNGTVHFLHITSKQIIFSKKLPLVKSAGAKYTVILGKCFIVNEGSLIIVLVTSTGQIVRIENIDQEQLLEGLKLRDIPFLNFIQSQISLRMDHFDQEETTVLSADCMSIGGTSKLMIWAGMKDRIHCWNSESLHTSQSISFSLFNFFGCLKIIQLLNGRYIGALDDQKCLHIICTHTGIIIWKSTRVMNNLVDIVDFYELCNNVSSSQLVLLTESEDTNGKLIILNIPSFEVSYEIVLMKNVFLLGTDGDTISFLEPEFKDNLYINFKLKSITDGDPETRLMKLLRKFKFDQAEEFCSTFGLNVEEVYKAKSRYLCDLINPLGSVAVNTTTLDQDTIARCVDDLLLTLSQIEDNEFVTTLCIEAPLLDISTTDKLLNYAKNRLTEASMVGSGDHLNALRQKVSQNIHCLHTFQNIYPSSDIHQWFTFSRSNMLEEFISHLKRDNLDTASTVWHRHQYEFLTLINEDCVSRILNAIPPTVTSKKLCAWLPKCLLKDLIILCPSSIETVSSWVCDRIMKLENFEKNQWPSNGYALATTTINVLDNVTTDFASGENIEIQMAVHMAKWKAHLPSSQLYRLHQMALALKDLQTLAEKFIIKVKFNQYTQECKKSVVAALLDWLVSGDEVAPLMEGFLRTYMIQHQLDCDETLAEYVSETLDTFEHNWWAWEEAPWEDKLYAVINYIADAQVRASCIVKCICVAPVPWSEGTKQICAIGKALNTHHTVEIELQECLRKLKIVLRRHNLHLIDFNNIINAELILRSITSRDRDNIMDDALIVVSAFKHLRPIDAYYFRLYYLMHKEKFDEAKELINNLDKQKRIYICNKYIHFVIQAITTKTYNIKHYAKLKILLSGTVALENVFRNYCTVKLIPDQFWTDVRRIYSMQVTFDLYPTLDNLHNPTICSSIFKNYIVDIYREDNKTEASQKTNILDGTKRNVTKQNETNNMLGTSKRFGISMINHTLHSNLNYTTKTMLNGSGDSDDSFKGEKGIWGKMEKIIHLSSLLGITRQDLFVLLASLAAKNGYMEDALNVIKLISGESLGIKNHVPVIYNIIQMIVDEQKDNKEDKNINCIQLIEELISTTLVSCSQDDIATLTDLGHWCQISRSLYSQCHHEDAFMGSNSSNDPYIKWKFSPLYSDPVAPLEEPLVTNGVLKVLDGNLKVYKNNKIEKNPIVDSQIIFNDEKTLKSLEDLNHHLKERGHDMLSLILSQNIYMTLLLSNYNLRENGFNKLNSQDVMSLLAKILSTENADLRLAISLLTHLTANKALRVLNDTIKRLGYDYSKLILVGKIGYDFCILNNLKDISNQFSILQKRSTWGAKLKIMDISFKASFSGNPKALSQVLKQLVAHKECTIYTLYEFCDEMSWNVEDALNCYLLHCLHSWSPRLTDLDNKDATQAVVQELTIKISLIIRKIVNKVALKTLFEEEFSNISSYNYEILDIVLTHLGSDELGGNSVGVNRGKDILNFLKVYKRQYPPEEMEKESWFQSHPDSRDLPDIVTIRLPFHELYNKNKIMTKIIDPELDINTVDVWLTIMEPLKLSRDQIYFRAALNTAVHHFGQEKSSTNWQLCSSNNSLLNQILKIISLIKHNELAVACANSIFNILSPGIDQVQVAKKCFSLAESWKSVLNDKKTDTFYKKFKIKYQGLAVEHILHKYGLAHPQYVNLVNDTETLLFRLYDHPTLSKLSFLNTDDLPDIKGCVSEICNVIKYDQTTVQLRLLQQWLPMKDEIDNDNELDETISNFQLSLEPNGAPEETGDYSYSKVIYLLRCFPPQQAISYLLKQALAPEGGISAGVRLKALRCLLAIADEATLQESGVKSIVDIRSKLQTMTYVCRLEDLGYATNETQFQSMDKNALVEAIWRSLSHNVEALILLIDMCCDFQISTASLWGALLSKLTICTEAGQLPINRLEKVLLQIKNIPHLWLLPQLSSAWELLIYWPFKKANSPLSKEALNSCIHSINLLIQNCHVSIPLGPLGNLCDSFDLPIFRLALSVLESSSEDDIQKFIDNIPKEKLKQQYDEVKMSLVLPKFVEDLLNSL